MSINVRTKVAEGGRIVIPVDIRRELGIEIGQDVNLSVEENELKITTSKSALQKLQETVQKATKGRSLVDELITERRRESKNE